MTYIDWPDDLPPPYPVERLSVEEYQRIIASGLLNPDRNVEFLEGVIVRKVRSSLRHDSAVEKLLEALRPLLPRGWSATANCAIVTRESQPEPDVAIACDKLQDAQSNSPRAADAALVIEVADNSLPYDRRSKGRIYARAAIPYYWVLNLLDGQLEVFSNPSGPVPMPGYQEQRVYRTDDKVSLVIGLDDLGAIRVGDVLP
jgi:Uma2 family endonuclease